MVSVFVVVSFLAESSFAIAKNNKAFVHGFGAGYCNESEKMLTMMTMRKTMTTTTTTDDIHSVRPRADVRRRTNLKGKR